MVFSNMQNKLGSLGPDPILLSSTDAMGHLLHPAVGGESQRSPPDKGTQGYGYISTGKLNRIGPLSLSDCSPTVTISSPPLSFCMCMCVLWPANADRKQEELTGSRLEG